MSWRLEECCKDRETIEGGVIKKLDGIFTLILERVHQVKFNRCGYLVKFKQFDGQVNLSCVDT